jgi:coproporphyrinogen III oxidase
MSISKETITSYFKDLQDHICKELEISDTKGKFVEDKWEHQSGGGGRTRVIENGKIIEKGGVNFSAVSGYTSEALQKQLKLDSPSHYTATGVSIVMHPKNPMVPIIHMNVRYFEMDNGTYWFGGGIDLTPHYIFDDQAIWFHNQLKNACDEHDTSYYPKFKQWADDYFYIPHRNETRGIGGIFFDYQKETETITKEQIFNFVKSIGNSFAPIYTHLMSLNAEKSFDESNKQWQFLRRGRYVEFNLVWDRGTKFGLETNGRTESILMSLPPQANWTYNYIPNAGTLESETLLKLIKGINWV